ncbi:precorrin-2 C20-methyltransferase [Rhodomicrobium vannielii ATCC 17100]|uniref:Precorrin-2 C20-methyltransferase n=1 Tax=Rhodomicrobium vannielii (strain ATCC 17100 / DSM 162 / LMG 4299 / NCIMB 10020 / ATH 3.1.1) TaxID=648757 RepID=E3I5L4_RHOVT|nr:precorrin-2 C(20)-methyltransferase [Rhodomicrobium vannielii]ADP72825.1 precorrin-2 C20-methyltransferase [Rhodomicrobium vannielii ATCC 17100]
MSPLELIAGGAEAGTLYGIGVGPGDVRYLTLRAAGLIRSVDVLACFAKEGRESCARSVAAPLIEPGREELTLYYPVTTEAPVEDAAYTSPMRNFYEASAERLAALLRAGRSVGLMGEGDPFFYGSFMHMWRRLERDYPVEIVPGVIGISGCAAKANAPLTWGDDVLTVLPGTLDEATLARRLADTDAAAIMKVGRNLAKVRRAVAQAGLLDRAIYVERGTMPGERVVPLADVDAAKAPYFSMILIPGNGRRI